MMNLQNAARKIELLNIAPHNNFNILLVANSLISNDSLHTKIEKLGHNLISAQSSEQMLEIIQNKSETIDIILLDLEISIDNIYANVKNIKTKINRNIPIIMLADNDASEMKKGLEAGIFYYLTKPLKEEILKSVLEAAINDLRQSDLLVQALEKQRTSFHLLESCCFSFKTLSEAESLSAFLANSFPNPQRILLGLGELMINAIEHGNLNIGYKRKSELVADGSWRAEIERRLNLNEFSHKTATVTVTRKQDGVYLMIEDMGDGFAWNQYMSFDPSRAGDNHGRGIALANVASFDRLTYNEKGNKAIAFMAFDPILE